MQYKSFIGKMSKYRGQWHAFLPYLLLYFLKIHYDAIHNYNEGLIKLVIRK